MILVGGNKYVTFMMDQYETTPCLALGPKIEATPFSISQLNTHFSIRVDGYVVWNPEKGTAWELVP